MRVRLYVAALVMVLLAGCGTARRGEPIAEPIQIDSQKVARGERAYMYHCNKCHPGGEAGLGFALNNKPLPAAMIKTQVRVGAGAMPAFSKELLPDNELDDIVAYLQTLRKSDGK
ncbi:cytochrome c [Geomonas sp. RF6]|uniref:c-type cytochrome n=1 Tax=Geomonas sp. RF6 TaxID=2897342 RepID=UPI001E2BFC46|nr:cytochrome c [Geomonas sp. RF6]UFS71459.1 cytochrome c [Geomonas sp. RF6]